MEIEELKQRLCIECQACCKILQFPIDNHSGVIDFYVARGLEVILEGGKLYVIVPHVCSHLSSSGCKIYPDRPLMCKVFDGRDDPALNCLWKKIN